MANLPTFERLPDPDLPAAVLLFWLPTWQPDPTLEELRAPIQAGRAQDPTFEGLRAAVLAVVAVLTVARAQSSGLRATGLLVAPGRAQGSDPWPWQPFEGLPTWWPWWPTWPSTSSSSDPWSTWPTWWPCPWPWSTCLPGWPIWRPWPWWPW